MNLTGSEENNFSEILVFGKKKFWHITDLIFDENKYVSNAAFELVNNLFISTKVCEEVASSEKKFEKLQTIFETFSSFVKRA